MILRSMTGFGRSEVSLTSSNLIVEMRSYNHRYLDILVRLPQKLQSAESTVRGLLTEHLTRGRVEVSCSIVKHPHGGAARGDSELNIEKVLLQLKTIAQKAGVPLSPEILPLIYTEAFVRPLPEHEELVTNDELHNAVKEALNALINFREEEGARLTVDIQTHLHEVENCRVLLVELAQQSAGRWRDRLKERIAKLGEDLPVDPQRFAQEVLFLIERAEVSEELERIKSHLTSFEYEVGRGDQKGVGRKLDFILQELTREFNTITSKCQDAQMQKLVIEGKTALEKIREQIQNIE